MRTAIVEDVEHLHCMPDQDGDHPVLLVKTSLPMGEINSFYMDLVDTNRQPVVVGPMLPPDGTPRDSTQLNIGDAIVFDVQDGLHKAIQWNSRKIRQRGYSFDTYGQTGH